MVVIVPLYFGITKAGTRKTTVCPLLLYVRILRPQTGADASRLTNAEHPVDYVYN